MQEDQLLAGSIGDNIAFFDPAPHIARIERCARVAGVHDEVAAMSMGYNTLVGDRGRCCRAGRSSAFCLHAPYIASRASWCSTRPLAIWT